MQAAIVRGWRYVRQKNTLQGTIIRMASQRVTTGRMGQSFAQAEMCIFASLLIRPSSSILFLTLHASDKKARVGDLSATSAQLS